MSSTDSERQAGIGLKNEAVEESPANVRAIGGRSLLWLPVATLIVGLLVTGALALVSHAQYTSNEKRLLRLRARDAAALIAQALPTVQTPLASAAELADATNGDVQKFKRFIAPYVGSGRGKQFASVSLWRLGAPQRGPVAVEGVQPKLAMSGAGAFFAQVARRPELNVIGLLQPPALRLGYAFAVPGSSGGFVAYGESPLPANRRSALQTSSQFAGLDYALYLGRGQRPQNLLVTDVAQPPAGGHADAETVPFGDSAFTLAMSSHKPLAGSLPQRLPWIIVIGGLLLSAGAALGTVRLTQRRRDAEQLAGRLETIAIENQRLYGEQRSIAQTLQHALLPEALPQIPGVQTSARYEAGEQGVDIGGDWYDVIDLEDGRLLLVVGDVSGRGLRAATTMALLRFAIHAYVAQRDQPAEILTKLSYLVSVVDSGQLATILFAVVDVERREISVTSAGHLPPLLIRNGDGHYVESEVGLPIGVEAGSAYASTTVSAPPAATLVAFTDGLVERRGEDLDQSLARLRQAAIGRDTALPELLAKLVSELQAGPSKDDIAILGLRWTT
jgi:serine phosphatase RsbU (regulator of sigma subunit)